jgi:hypothetical protein
MKMEQIECSETSAYKIQTPGHHPEENIQNAILHSSIMENPFFHSLGTLFPGTTNFTYGASGLLPYFRRIQRKYSYKVGNT